MIRRARRADVPALVALLADDPLGATVAPGFVDSHRGVERDVRLT